MVQHATRNAKKTSGTHGEIARGASVWRRIGLRPPSGARRILAFLLAGGFSVFLWACCSAAAKADPSKKPSDAESLLKTLDPFYKQHVLADGLLIVGSEKVSPYALHEAAHLVRKMLAARPDVLKTLVERKIYVGVMAYNEMTTDIPEQKNIAKTKRAKLWWDKRARGLGGNPVTCGEENLLSYPGDPYQGENIFIHEFAHIVQGAVAQLDDGFNSRLRALYEKTKQSGRFRGYGMTNRGEFWAEGVQSWFNCNRRGGLEALGPKQEHVCEVNTREQMKTYLPEFAKLLDKALGHNQWVYVPVLQRLDQAHLTGYKPAQAPTFRWPPEVIKAYNQIEAEKAEKRKSPK